MGVYSRKSKRDGLTYWYVRHVLPNGRRKKEKLGTRKKDAVDLLAQRRTEIRLGTYRDPGTPEPESVTFRDLARRFLEEYASERRSNYYYHVLLGANPSKPTPMMAFFGERRLADLEADPTLFDQFRRQRMKGVGASTVRKNLTVLGTMFRQARRWKLVRTNPLEDVDKPTVPENLDRPLSREEWSRLMEAAEPWLKPILQMAAATGARLKEVVGLTWENVDLKDGIVYFSSDNKTGKPRAVPLGQVARSVLSDVQSSRFRKGTVFLDAKGQPYTSTRARNRISKRTKAAMRAAAISGASFKSIRTTVGTVLAEADHSEVKIGTLLGHSWAKDRVTGKHYIRIRINHLRPLVKALDDWLGCAPASVVDRAPSVQE